MVTFKTLIKADHKLGKDDFVFGRIMGAMAVLCKDDPAMGIESGYSLLRNGDRVIIAKTTIRQYDSFVNVIESWYPGLCVFKYAL